MRQLLPVGCEGLSEIIGPYQGLILDLWGVVHDGVALKQGVFEAITRARYGRIKILLLSNSPRRKSEVETMLAGMGLHRHLYSELLTSGELVYLALRYDDRYQKLRKYFYLGPPSLEELLSESPDHQSVPIGNAEFILVTGYAQDMSERNLEIALDYCASRNLPMICANPDRVVEIQGTMVPCAGSVADRYLEKGGEVLFFGKPELSTYVAAIKSLDLPRNRILAIGDGMATDIAGANRADVASLLVTDGIHTAEVIEPDTGIFSIEKLAILAAQFGAYPDYVTRSLRW